MQRDVLANETAVQMRFYESNKSVPLVNNGFVAMAACGRLMVMHAKNCSKAAY